MDRGNVKARNLNEKLKAMVRMLEKAKRHETELPNVYSHYFDLTYSEDGQLLMFTEKTKTVERELELCGYFTIVTSSKMSAREALQINKSRDKHEKLFREDKSYLGASSMGRSLLNFTVLIKLV